MKYTTATLALLAGVAAAQDNPFGDAVPDCAVRLSPVPLPSSLFLSSIPSVQPIPPLAPYQTPARTHSNIPKGDRD